MKTNWWQGSAVLMMAVVSFVVVLVVAGMTSTVTSEGGN